MRHLGRPQGGGAPRPGGPAGGGSPPPAGGGGGAEGPRRGPRGVHAGEGGGEGGRQSRPVVAAGARDNGEATARGRRSRGRRLLPADERQEEEPVEDLAEDDRERELHRQRRELRRAWDPAAHRDKPRRDHRRGRLRPQRDREEVPGRRGALHLGHQHRQVSQVLPESRSPHDGGGGGSRGDEERGGGGRHDLKQAHHAFLAGPAGPLTSPWL
mmetsp:Transcript_33996/g.95603  ORF Transcript_33996/g.95603 Transcript_33996/m.95603 type:complete len:213 (-) Transcript_33996:109-747(-)